MGTDRPRERASDSASVEPAPACTTAPPAAHHVVAISTPQLGPQRLCQRRGAHGAARLGPLRVAPALWSRSFASGGFLPKEEVSSRVLDVVKNFQNVDPAKVTATSHFINDLGLDSLDTVEMVMAFEDEFAVEIPDAEAEKIHTVDQAVT